MKPIRLVDFNDISVSDRTVNGRVDGCEMIGEVVSPFQ